MEDCENHFGGGTVDDGSMDGGVLDTVALRCLAWVEFKVGLGWGEHQVAIALRACKGKRKRRRMAGGGGRQNAGWMACRDTEYSGTYPRVRYLYLVQGSSSVVATVL